MFLRITAVLLAFALVGCQQCAPQSEPEAEAPEAGARLVELVSPLGELEGGAVSDRYLPAVSNLRQHSFQTVGSDTDPSVDSTGQWMVFASTGHSERPDIFLKTVEGKTLTQLTSDPASDIQPAFAPDGRNVAFASNRSGAWEIYVISINGKSLRQVTRGGGQNMHPSWSPDGTRLAYCCQSARSGQWELWLASLAAPDSRQFVGYGLFPVWSPTEDIIAYQRARGRSDRIFGIWTIRLTNGEPSLPTVVASAADQAFVSPAFSADGKRLAFSTLSASPQGGSADIYTVDLNGDNLQRLTQGLGQKFSPAWARGRIFFCCNRDGHDNVWSVQADNSQPTPESVIPAGHRAVSPVIQPAPVAVPSAVPAPAAAGAPMSIEPAMPSPQEAPEAAAIHEDHPVEVAKQER